MSSFKTTDTVGEIVACHPALSRLFEQEKIDYCCGGRKTLEEVCRSKGVDPEVLLITLEEALAAEGMEQEADLTGMSLSDLADHIEQTHHADLRSELPRLTGMTAKVAGVHGERDARLHRVRDTFLALAEELFSHMMKEESVLFPMIRQLEAGSKAPAFHCGTLANPIRQMESEHDQAGSALEQMRGLTDGYTPPEWACNTYRALLDALARLERDMHRHVHKENNVLFPRALEMEKRKRTMSHSDAPT